MHRAAEYSFWFASELCDIKSYGVHVGDVVNVDVRHVTDTYLCETSWNLWKLK